jgi:site-specific DNA recombinase
MREELDRPRRCAIYTRKSTDEGLDQAFNSLDAQREACAAYIMSQAHEGWRLETTVYDDGGFSGGTLERPALTRMLAEVHAGRIDIIVVYKVDRLTRSLADFAKIVDVLDGAGASFVSITQSFNTTTSMGRLTLNVLLSFAQFEREVISERVRDKIAASKAKGMWMGGPVPLGYRVENRKLLAVETEAATVRLIMETYLVSRSVAELAERLRASEVVSKVQIMRDGSTRGGGPYVRGPLYCLLKNRIYVGDITHKGKVYPGEHEGIIARNLFDEVQRKLADATRNTTRGTRRTVTSLLTGRIRDERGRPMTPTHSLRQGKRYRYYASNDPRDAAPAQRLAAGDLDAAIITSLGTMLCDRSRLCDAAIELDARSLKNLTENCDGLAAKLASASPREQVLFLHAIDIRVDVHARAAEVSVSFAALLKQADIDRPDQITTCRLAISVSLHGFRYGHEARVRIEPTGSCETLRMRRVADLVVAAIAARDQLAELAEVDRNCTTVRHLQRTARLAYIDPAIITALLDDGPTLSLGARDLLRMPSLPLCWSKQRQLVGLA